MRADLSASQSSCCPDYERQKERLPHGMFLPWVDREFAMSEWTARNFMNVAEVYGKSGTVPDLQAKALYELAKPSTPTEVRDRVESLLVDGQKVTANRLAISHKSGTYGETDWLTGRVAH